MHFAAAHAILAAREAPDLRRDMRENAGLIWAEHGDEVDQWNALAATQGWGDIDVRREELPGQEERTFYTYKGQEVQCVCEGDREDNLRSVLVIAELVKADAELYACSAHAGNSEQGFFALRPEQWRSLEAEFGTQAVASHFTRASGSYDEFCDQYFRDENLSAHGEPERDPAADALAALLKLIRDLGLSAGCSLATNYTLVFETHLHILLVTDFRHRSIALYKDRDFRAAVTAICQQLCQRCNYRLENIAFLSQEELDADADGKWTFGWMTAGACLQWRFVAGAELKTAPASLPWKVQALGFVRKHWLPIGFLTLMLAVLIFGKR